MRVRCFTNINPPTNSSPSLHKLERKKNSTGVNFMMSFPFSLEFLQSQGHKVKRPKKSSSANPCSNRSHDSRRSSREDLTAVIPTLATASSSIIGSSAKESDCVTFQYIESTDHLTCLISIPTSSSIDTPTLFISGACNITLLFGNAALHGWQLRAGQKQQLVVPSWMPAAALQIGATSSRSIGTNNPKRRDRRNCDLVSISSLLQKFNIQNHSFSEKDMKVCSCNVVMCLIESIDEDVLYHN